VRNLGPIFPFLLFTPLFQNRTAADVKISKGGGQLLFRHGMEITAKPDLQSCKRGEVLKPLVVQRFQFFKTPNFK
jgi:hypothetical protein